VQWLHRAGSASKHGHWRAGSDSDMREFAGHDPAAYKHDARPQLVEIQELIARREMLVSRNAEIGGDRAGCDQHSPTDQLIVADAECGGSDEPGPAAERGDAGLRECRLALFGHAGDDRSLKSHQRRPADARATRNEALAVEASNRIDRLGRADENYFRVAAAQ